jgi:hypothetical protein
MKRKAATGRPRKQRSKPLPVGGWQPKVYKPLPARKPDESDESYWLRVLPTPPAVASDASVCGWLSDILFVAGAPGLEWAFRAENFPESLKPWRMRNDHWYHRLMRQAEMQANREREAAAREQQARVEDTRQDERRAAGWA